MTRPLLALLLTLALPLHAALNDAPDFSDPVENTRYQHLIQNIRCPTCQNSNIAESNAPLARQLREQVAARIREEREAATRQTEAKENNHHNRPAHLGCMPSTEAVTGDP